MIDYPLLRPIACLYGHITKIRAKLYEGGYLTTKRLPCTVISVGNLTLGGTGKTPVTMWLAKHIMNHGKKVAIVSRGYKAKSGKPVSVVSDGHRVLLAPTEAGDEPFMMGKNLPGVPLVIGKKRFAAGRKAVEGFSPDVILLDDAYQHLQLARDLNLLLLRTAEPFGNGYVFPAGVLREPLSALERADAFVLTHAEEVSETVIAAQTSLLRAKYPGKHIFISRCKPRSFYFLSNPRTCDPLDLKNTRAFAFCGIAHPESFLRTLDNLGINLVDFAAYRDHYPYDRRDLEHIGRQAAQSGADLILTTEKDAVKVADFKGVGTPVAVLKVEYDFEPGFEDFISKQLGIH